MKLFTNNLNQQRINPDYFKGVYPPLTYENDVSYIPDVDLDGDSWDTLVIVVAGQSNAVGYDESAITQANKDQESDRALQLGFKGNDNLKYVRLTPCAQNYQDMTQHNTNPNSLNGEKGTKGIHLPLAYELLKKLPDNKKIVIIPVAYGGTGFDGAFPMGSYDSNNKRPSADARRWGETTPFYYAMRDRLKFVLDDTSIKAKFGGVVWCLGEFDGTQNKFNSFDSGFRALIARFETDFESYKAKSIYNSFGKDCWFAYETVQYWYMNAANFNTCQRIWAEQRIILGKDNYIRIPRNTPSNATNGTGQTSSNRPTHYGNDAFMNTIAPAVANAITYKASLTSKIFSNPYVPTQANPALMLATEKNGGLDPVADQSIVEADGVITGKTFLQGYTSLDNMVLFRDDVKVAIWQTGAKGAWAVFSTNNYANTSNMQMGVMGLLDTMFGRVLKLTRNAFEIKKNESGAMNELAAMDLIIGVKFADKIRYYIYHAKNNSIEQKTQQLDKWWRGDYTKSKLGAVIGITYKDAIWSEDRYTKRLGFKPAYATDLSAFFADVNNPKVEEVAALAEEYYKL